MMMMSLERKTTRICTTLVWVLALALQLPPIIATAGYDETTKQEDKQPWHPLSYLIQVHLGFTLPLSLTIIANILTSMKL